MNVVNVTNDKFCYVCAFYHNKAKQNGNKQKARLPLYAFGKGREVFWPRWNARLPLPQACSASCHFAPNPKGRGQHPGVTPELLSQEGRGNSWWVRQGTHHRVRPSESSQGHWGAARTGGWWLCISEGSSHSHPCPGNSSSCVRCEVR